MKAIMKPLITAILLPALLVPAIAPAEAQGSCLGRRETQQLVASGTIVPLDSALSDAGIESDQEVLSVQVCDQGGWVYVVAILGPDGYAQNLVLPATY